MRMKIESVIEPWLVTLAVLFNTEGALKECAHIASTSGHGMIAEIANLEPGRLADAVPVDRGVVFRLPTGRGTMLMASRGASPMLPVGLSIIDFCDLQRRSMSETVVGYRGSCDQYHYFCMPYATGYRIRKEQLRVSDLPVTLGLCLFVTVVSEGLGMPSEIRMIDVDPIDCHWALEW